MRWLSGPLLFLFCIGQRAAGELFNFDLSSLRPDEPCKPTKITHRLTEFSTSGKTVNFCPVENHIKVFSGEFADNKTFLQRIERIRNSSATRAVDLHIYYNATLVDAALLAPIGQQIVAFSILMMFEGNLTSRLPAIGLTNLLDLRFWYCEGLRIHKADFSGLTNIRVIEFTGHSPAFLDQGTFTDLPDLQTLALGNAVGDWNMDQLAVYKKLKCDAQNAWLWEYIKGKPGSLKSRNFGTIFKLGNFSSACMGVDQPKATCE